MDDFEQGDTVRIISLNKLATIRVAKKSVAGVWDLQVSLNDSSSTATRVSSDDVEKLPPTSASGSTVNNG